MGIEGEATSSRDLRAVFALGRHVGRDPILIAQLVRIAIDRKALDVTRDLLLKSEDLGDLSTASIAWVEEGGIRVLRSGDGEDRWELTANSEGGSGESGR